MVREIKKSSHESPATSHAPRILVTNDDGINAPGLTVLETIARALSDDVWVVAPEQEQSGSAHSLTLHLPVRIRQLEEKRFAVNGTPTDNVLLALQQIIGARGEGRGVSKKKNIDPRPSTLPPVDLVLSGVNRGSNAGDDVTYSGTVAAAMEGTILDVPSIALSQHGDRANMHWQTAEKHAPELIRRLIKTGWPKGTLININFPDCLAHKVKGVKICPQGKRVVNVALSERIDPKGRTYFWIGGERDNTSATPDTDLAFLEKNYITVTPLCMDLTDHETMRKMRKALK